MPHVGAAVLRGVEGEVPVVIGMGMAMGFVELRIG